MVAAFLFLLWSCVNSIEGLNGVGTGSYSSSGALLLVESRSRLTAWNKTDSWNRVAGTVCLAGKPGTLNYLVYAMAQRYS